ncbi:MAG: hypothetical protein Q9180_001840 [Flavoplaca navasiana]
MSQKATSSSTRNQQLQEMDGESKTPSNAGVPGILQHSPATTANASMSQGPGSEDGDSQDGWVNCADLISDDSSFYGDDDDKARLEAKCAAFDPASYWEHHEHLLPVVAAKARHELDESVLSAGSAQHEKNSTGSQHQIEALDHRQTSSSSLRADESLETFLTRLPPQNVRTEGHWIQIDRPSANPMGSGQGDPDTFLATGREILNKLPFDGNAWQSRKAARADLLSAARTSGLKSGKWIIFSPFAYTNTLWSLVAGETLAGQLGHTSRVATAGLASEGWKRRIEVYTADFDKLGEVEGVLERLVDLIKSQGVMGQVGRLCYKPEAFSALGIRTGNKWGMHSSIYSRATFQKRKQEDLNADCGSNSEMD